MKRGLKLPRHFAIRPSGAVELKGIESLKLAHGVPLYLVRGGNEPVFRLELMFRAGKLYESQRHAASATAALMTEGTTRLTANELAEALEFYGATVRTYSTPDTLTVSVHAMSRFSVPVLDIVREILVAPAFAESELAIYQKKKLQRFKLSQMQNEYQANRVFSEFIFGSGHPYGYLSSPEDVLAVSPATLRGHHEMLGTKTVDVFLAGEASDVIIDHVDRLITGLPEGVVAPVQGTEPQQKTGKWHLPGPQAHQASVRIGKQIISRGHDDYPGLFLLNTILGGYHGSRLVRNLREAKGLTYSIQSNLENLLQATCFVISTDANGEAKGKVIREIYREIQKVRTQGIGEAELEMVRNYVCGNFLMQIDGPLNVVETIKPLVLHHLPFSYFEEFLIALRHLTPEDVKELAEVYLDADTMTEVVVG